MKLPRRVVRLLAVIAANPPGARISTAGYHISDMRWLVEFGYLETKPYEEVVVQDKKQFRAGKFHPSPYFGTNMSRNANCYFYTGKPIDEKHRLG